MRFVITLDTALRLTRDRALPAAQTQRRGDEGSVVPMTSDRRRRRQRGERVRLDAVDRFHEFGRDGREGPVSGTDRLGKD